MSAATIVARPRYCVDAIPAELQALPRWVVFQIIHLPNGKTKKFPLIAGKPGRHPAASDNPRTWCPFDVALADAEARGLYLAFVFDRDLPYFFLDVDDVIQPDGTIRADVVLVRDQLDTYTEWSASGNGLHIIGRGAFPERSANRPTPDGCKALERYPLRGPHFCIFTGNTLPGMDTIEERGAVLAALFPPWAAAHANGSTSSAGYQGPAGQLTDDEVEAIVRWARPLWTDGRRHHMALYLSGELARQGVSREQAATSIERCAADDSDPGAKLTACHDTYDGLEAGETVSGWHGLRDVCGLADDDLAPLSTILDGFWRRHNAGNPPRTDERDRARAQAAKEATGAAPAPAFPLDALPPTVRAYVEAAADSLRVPPEMVAVPLLGLAGALIGNRLHLVLKNSWREYLTLYLAIVARPGSAKSPALSLAQWPLDALQKSAHVRYTERMEAYDDELEAWRQTKDREKPPKPQLRHYFSTDLTVEALAGMLAGAPGVAIIRDEISGWVAAMDQYKGGKGSDRQQFLSLWSAQTLKVDRKGSAGSVYVPKPVVCVVGGIQPDLAGTLHDAAKRRDGFVERVLPLVPDVEPAQWTDAAPSTELYRDVLAVFETLDRLERPDDGYGVELSPEARASFVAWVDENAGLVKAADGLAEGFYSKLPAHVARFALILHALWNPQDPRPMLNAARMEDAIELGEFFRAHISRFLALLNATAPASFAGLATRIERILRTAHAGQDDGWVARAEIYRRLGNIGADELTDALDRMIESGKIEQRIAHSTTKHSTQYRLRSSQYSHNSGKSRAESGNKVPGEAKTTNTENYKANGHDDWIGGEEGVL